jgi:hypothetical protein
MGAAESSCEAWIAVTGFWFAVDGDWQRLSGVIPLSNRSAGKNVNRIRANLSQPQHDRQVSIRMAILERAIGNEECRSAQEVGSARFIGYPDNTSKLCQSVLPQITES